MDGQASAGGSGGLDPSGGVCAFERRGACLDGKKDGGRHKMAYGAVNIETTRRVMGIYR